MYSVYMWQVFDQQMCHSRPFLEELPCAFCQLSTEKWDSTDVFYMIYSYNLYMTLFSGAEVPDTGQTERQESATESRERGEICS